MAGCPARMSAAPRAACARAVSTCRHRRLQRRCFTSPRITSASWGRDADRLDNTPPIQRAQDSCGQRLRATRSERCASAPQRHPPAAPSLSRGEYRPAVSRGIVGDLSSRAPLKIAVDCGRRCRRDRAALYRRSVANTAFCEVDGIFRHHPSASRPPEDLICGGARHAVPRSASRSMATRPSGRGNQKRRNHFPDRQLCCSRARAVTQSGA